MPVLKYVKVLCSLLWVTLLRQGVGLGDPQRSLPTPTILGFCDPASARGWTRWPTEVPSNPDHFVILSLPFLLISRISPKMMLVALTLTRPLAQKRVSYLPGSIPCPGLQFDHCPWTQRIANQRWLQGPQICRPIFICSALHP